MCFDRLLTRNSCKMRVGGSVSFQKPERILQICHSVGLSGWMRAARQKTVWRSRELLEVSLLYLTDDDAAPVGAISEVLPFSGTVEAEGIREDCVWQLNLGLEQLGAVMLGGGEAEVKAQLHGGTACIPADAGRGGYIRADTAVRFKALEQQPGIVGYIVQPGILCGKLQKNSTRRWIRCGK